MNSDITTPQQLDLAMRKLVTDICAYAESPEAWPLEPQSQQAFIRCFTIRALKIKHTGPFLGGEVINACNTYVDTLGLRPVKKKPGKKK